jgi:hypothetical protein
MSTINSFIREFKGGARPNLFEVGLEFPAGASNSLAKAKAKFLVKGASLPASVINPIEVPFRGRKFKVAGDRTYENWTITVINDHDFEIRKAMENWMGYINRATSNTTGSTSSAYTADLSVTQLSREGSESNPTKLANYSFIGAFPVNISAIELNFETNDAVEEFTVEFAYQYWEKK